MMAGDRVLIKALPFLCLHWNVAVTRLRSRCQRVVARVAHAACGLRCVDGVWRLPQYSLPGTVSSAHQVSRIDGLSPNR